MKPSLFSIISLTLTMLLSGSCTHKDLNEDAPKIIADNVDVVFDWSKVPDAKASSMILYLYPESHDVMNYWFNNSKGGIIRTYSGKHTAVCHSNDDPYIHCLRNQDSHDEIEIYTDETALLVGQGISTKGIPRAEGTEDEPLRVTPSMIYGDQRRDISFKATSDRQTLTFYPEELVCHYTVEFVNVENIQSADLRIDATISSLAGGYYPGLMKPNSEVVSHTFTLTPDIEHSDAIAIAMRTHAPIYTTHEVVTETGFIINDNDLADSRDDAQDADAVTDSDLPGADYFAEPKLENYAIEELERTLAQLIEDENYEEAARVNEILQRKRAARDGDNS